MQYTAFFKTKLHSAFKFCCAWVLIIFSNLQPSYAQTLNPPKNIWVLMNSGILQPEPVSPEWRRAQQSNGALFKSLHSIDKTLTGIVAPVFDNGRAHYATQIAPFANRNPEAAADEKALRQLLATAKAQKVPVYLAIDALAWQKDGLETDPPKDGIFAQHPDWREMRQQGVRPQAPEAFYASPWKPEVRQALGALLDEIGTKFPDAAGIVLNLRLSDREILGFSDAARLASIRDAGFDPFDLNLQNRASEENNALVQQWRAWKRGEMSALLQELRAAYRKAQPQDRVLAWGTADYYERQEANDLRSSQDWRGWLKTGAADGVLLEGRWTPRYNDAAQFAETLADDIAPVAGMPKVIPVSSGSHLVGDSSFAQDWSALASRADELDTMAFVVREDADVKSVVRLGSGQETLTPPPAPKVNEPFPDYVLNLPDGETWQTRQVRGKTALALLLNPNALADAEKVAAPERLPSAVRLALVSDDSSSPLRAKVTLSASQSAPAANVPLHLVDARRDLLSSYGKAARLVVVDRAGWVRQVASPANGKELSALLQKLSDPTPQLAVGQPAPDFLMPDMDGKLRHLSDLRGKSNVLLTFFPKCFTGGCANHLTSLRDKTAEFARTNTRIWAVSIDPADVQIAFAKSLSLPFPMLPDTGRHLSMLYDAAQSVDELSARYSFLIDKSGIVRWIDHDVHVQTHGADVLAKMQELKMTP